MGRGLQEAAELVEKDMEKYQDLLESAVMRRVPRQTTYRGVTNLWEPSSFQKCKRLSRKQEWNGQNGLWWPSELKEAS